MKTINVLGIEYSIAIVSASELMSQLKESNPSYEEIKSELGTEGQHFAGLCDNMSCTIWINRDITNREKMKKVLVHEIIEAIDAEGLLGIEHSKLQSITNGLFTAKLIDLDGLLDET